MQKETRERQKQYRRGAHLSKQKDKKTVCVRERDKLNDSSETEREREREDVTRIRCLHLAMI